MDNETSENEFGEKDVGEKMPKVLTVCQYVGPICSEFTQKVHLYRGSGSVK